MSKTVDLRELAIDRGDTAQPKLRTRKHLFTRYVLPLVLVVGFLSLVAWASRDLVFPPKPVTVMPVISTTSEVQQEGTPLFKAAGWIEPRPTPVRVAALAPGVVEKLLVVEDQVVKKGTPIAEMVKDDARLAHDRVQADLQLRLAELEESNSQLKAAMTRYEKPVHLVAEAKEAEAALAKIETELKNLPFELQRANADLNALQKDYDGKVSSKGVVAGVTIDIAKSKLDSATAMSHELHNREVSLQKEQQALSARRDALNLQHELLADETNAKETATAQVKAAKARVDQAKVVVAQAKLQLDRMTIVSPIDGRIFRLFAHPGARIGSGMSQMAGHDGSTVVTMYQPEMLQIRVDVRFEDIPKVGLNQPVEINNPALPAPLMGSVLFISSEADIQKNTLQVKVAIPSPPSVFKPEMLVDVTFLAPEQLNRSEEPSKELKLYVPQQLVQTDESGSFIWVADQSDGKARKTSVQTGKVGSGALVEITSGLAMTSRLIVNGTNGLQDGQRIVVSGEDTSLSPISGIQAGDEK
ncbi:MAG: efflux RND transporter periplasmic adaptor subunit [Pirellulales bacterium]